MAKKGWLFNPGQSDKELEEKRKKELKEMDRLAKESEKPPKGPGLLWSLVSLIATCDYITPTIGIVETVINDPTPLQSNSWTFFIPYENSVFGRGWNANDIEKLLNENGIKTWGSQITNGEFFVSVSRDEAQWAEYILNKNNVPITPKLQGAPAPRTLEEKNSGFWNWLTGGGVKKETKAITSGTSEPKPSAPIKRTGHRTYYNIPCLVNNKDCDSYAHSMSCSICGYCTNHCSCFE